MNIVLDTIKKRRSIRKYLPNQIKDDELATIIEAATYAPSGHNSQPWHFTIIQDKELIDFINEKTKQTMVSSSQEWAVKQGSFEPYHIFYHAPTVVIVSGNKSEHSPLPLAETDFSYTPLVDCAAAIQNILLTAESIGIGSCWIGFVNFFFALPDVKKLKIPDNYQPYFAVTLGYKDNSVSVTTGPKRKPDVTNYIR